MQKHIAIDLGAESGRVVAGDLKEMDVIHRFTNRPVRLGTGLFWDILGIFNEIKIGLKQAFKKYPEEIVSLGIDTWGVDFGLLDKDGDLLGQPYHYRDDRTDKIMETVFQKVDKETIFEETGIQFLQINSLYQLYAFSRTKKEQFRQARHFLTIPDLLNFWLTGKMKNEYSIATTTQLYNPGEKDWSDKLIKKLGFDRSIFKDIIMPGTIIGNLLPHVAKETGAAGDVKVIAPACHDTASAVVAVPVVEDKNFAYLSSGTWSLLGVEEPEPLINELSFKYNFTNEGSATGGIRFLKNIMGLWIIQQCKRDWDEDQREFSYTELMHMAKECSPVDVRIDPNNEIFLKPSLLNDRMSDRVISSCQKTTGKSPKNKAEIVRVVLESLAHSYALTIKQIEQVTTRPVTSLYIIGGGAKNTFLCQLTANKAGIPVYAGPVEATALGNILVQSVAMKELSTVSHGRKIIAESWDIKRYDP